MTPHAPISVRRLSLLLGALAMFGPFSIDTVFPAFPALESAFATHAAGIQQVISVYLLGYAAMSLLHGALADALGRKPVILGNAVIFILASIGCALAESLPELLAWRLVQGLCAGAGFIVGRAVIRDVMDGADAQRLMARVSMVFSLAPALAPVMGGWILGVGQWQDIFWALAVFGGLIVVSIGALLPETHPAQRRQPLQVAPLMANYLHMLRNGGFLWGVSVITLNFAALFLYISSAPAFVMDHLGLSEQQFGWFFIPVIGGMLAGALFVNRVAGRYSSARILRIGFTACLMAAVLNLGVSALVPSAGYPWPVLPLIPLAFGVSIVFPEMMVALLDQYPDQRGSASAMQAFLSLLFHAGVAGLLSPLLSHSLLALSLGSATLSVLAFVTFRMGRTP